MLDALYRGADLLNQIAVLYLAVWRTEFLAPSVDKVPRSYGSVSRAVLIKNEPP